MSGILGENKKGSDSNLVQVIKNTISILKKMVLGWNLDEKKETGHTITSNTVFTEQGKWFQDGEKN